MGQLKYTTETFKEELQKKNSNYIPITEFLGSNKDITCICIKCDRRKTSKASDFMRNRVHCDCENTHNKKTDEEFVQELKEKNPTIKAIEEYKGAREKIWFQCELGHKFKAAPYSVLGGTKCRKCNGTALKTNEEFLQELHDKNPNIEPLEPYINSTTKIKLYCHKCNRSWDAAPVSTLRTQGSGCPFCAGVALKTNEEYIQEVKEKFPNIKVIGTYVNGGETLNYKCNVCNSEWEGVARDILDTKNGCVQCFYNSMRKEHDDFVNQVKEIHPDIEVISIYKSTREKVDLHCNKCNHEWSSDYQHLVTRKQGCAKCAGILRSNIEELQEKLNEKDKTIIVSGEYVNRHTDVNCYCTLCNRSFQAKPVDLLSYKKGCPTCKKSKGEKRVMNFLTNNNIPFLDEYRFDDCRYKNTLPFDFYLQNINTIIEYDGEEHFMPVKFSPQMTDEEAEENFKKCQIRDGIKNRYCEQHNIKLIRIPYWEFDNIEKILSAELLDIENNENNYIFKKITYKNYQSRIHSAPKDYGHVAKYLGCLD